MSVVFPQITWSKVNGMKVWVTRESMKGYTYQHEVIQEKAVKKKKVAEATRQLFQIIKYRLHLC